MKTKDLVRLGAIAVVALGAALWIGAKRGPDTGGASAGGYLAPGLKDELNAVTSVRLIGAEGKPIATLGRTDTGWTVAERAGFGADAAKVRELLLKLSDTQLIEAKTAKPELHAKLGVEDKPAKDAVGVRVDIETKDAKKAYKLIIGRPNAQGGDGTFVRRADEPQAWLAKGTISVDKNTGDWLKRDLVDIPSVRIATAELGRDGKTLKAYKNGEKDQNFLVADLPKGRELSSEFAANALGAVLAGLKFDDVKPAAEASAPADARTVRYATFDGVVVSGRTWEAETKDYAQFEASLDEGAARAAIERAQAKEVADYNEKLAAANAAKPPEPKKDGAEGEGKPAAAAKAPEPAAPPKPEPPLAMTDKDKDTDARLDRLRKEVADLKARFDGWTFVVPAFKYANMNRTMDDLLKPVEAKPAKDAKDAKAPKAPAPLVPPKG